MSPRNRHNATATDLCPTKTPSNFVAARLVGCGTTPRICSTDLLSKDGLLIIEHAGREYHLRVTNSGKLILTA